MTRVNSGANRTAARISPERCCNVHWCDHLKDDIANAIIVSLGEVSNEEVSRLRKLIDSGSVSMVFQDCRKNAHKDAVSPYDGYICQWFQQQPSFSSGVGSVFNLNGDLHGFVRYEPTSPLSDDDEVTELRSVWNEVGEHLWDGLRRFTISFEPNKQR